MNKIFLNTLFVCWLLAPLFAIAQKNFQPTGYKINKRDLAETRAKQIEYLTFPDSYRKIKLPAEVDNSKKPYFRGVFTQGWYPSCMQSSSVGYLYNYEINRVRHKPADTSVNLHPVLYTWNYANDEGEDGLDFFFSWDVIKQQGIPDVETYGADALEFLPTLWMTGYDKYYKAMGNRLDEICGIKLDSEDGINTLRAWLFDHLEGATDGGFAMFASSGYGPMLQFAPGTPEAGKNFWPHLLDYVSHGLTIVGYNDSVRYDYNYDGKYTNSIDINNDGVVNVLDWEKGAFKIVNSWGEWADSGFIYLMYNCFAHKLSDGGVWNSSAYIVKTSPVYEPELTMKVRLKHNNRENIRIRAGISGAVGVNGPEHVMEFPIFNFQGGPHGMIGIDSLPDGDEIEVGFDISELKKYAQPGSPSRFYLLVDEADPQDFGSGSILNYSVIDYMAGGTETSWNQGTVAITNNSTTTLFVDKVLQFNKMAITNQTLPAPGGTQPYQIQLNATGGVPPYLWNLNYQYTKSEGKEGFKAISQNTAEPYGVESNVAIPLPFSFPFYGKSYDTVFMNRKGMLVFTNDELPPRYFDDYLILLKNNIVINPAFNDEYVENIADGDGMWYALSQDTAYFRWKLSITDFEEESDLNFEVRLLRTGEILMNYGTMEVYGQYGNYPGISAGNNTCLLLDDATELNTFQGKKFKYFQLGAPAFVELSREGLLTVKDADSVYIQSVSVEVSDNEHNGDQRTFNLSDGLDFEAYPDAGIGTLINYNATTSLKLKVINSMPSALQNGIFKLSCNRSDVQILDSTAQINSLSSGGNSILVNAFGFRLLKPVTAGEAIEFEVTAYYNGGHRIKRVFLVVGAPNVVAYKAFVNDGENHLIDPGETTHVDFLVQNSGNLKCGPVDISISSTDERITISPVSNQSFDSLAIGQQLKISCLVSASPDIPIADSIFIHVSIAYNHDLDTVYTFGFQIGNFPVTLINLSGQTATIDSMANILNALDIPYQSYNYMPFSISNKLAIFLSLGCVSPAHTLTANEYQILISYLNGGGRLYLEGYYFWFFNTNNLLQPWFRSTIQSTSTYFFNELKGNPDGPTSGMDLKYNGKMYLGIYELQPDSGAVNLLVNPLNKPIQYAFDEGSYRVIGSACEFGQIQDSLPPSTKSDLMKVYLDYFGVDLSGIREFFHADQPEGCTDMSFGFTDDSYGQIVSRSWSFPGGTPAASEDINPQIVYSEPGIYDVTLEVSNGTATRTITKKNYITVNSCEGIREPSKAGDFEIYPNPATDVVNISFQNQNHNYTNCIIRNISGATVMQLPLQHTEKQIVINVKNLSQGFYMLSLYDRYGRDVTKKLIIR